MRRLTSLAVTCFFILFSVTACGKAQSVSYDPKLGWINEVGPQGNDYWIVTNTRVSPDQPIGKIGIESLGGQVDANVLPSGTQLYSIKAEDQTKVIAVALDYGQQGYVEAVNVGSKQPK